MPTRQGFWRLIICLAIWSSNSVPQASMAPLTRSMKRKINNKSQISAIQSLPKDLLLQVLSKVASSSFDDIISAKLACKDFSKMAEDDHIFECVSISKFPWISWRRGQTDRKLSRFFRRCVLTGNAEALYRKGMQDLIKGRGGMECLKRAALKGHAEATYVYGAILVCFGGGSKPEGLEFLYSLNSQKSKGLNITECRERVKSFVWSMWVDRDVIARIIQLHEESRIKICKNCGSKQGSFTDEKGWNFYDHDKFSSCNSCRWNQEVNIFCDILHQSRNL